MNFPTLVVISDILIMGALAFGFVSLNKLVKVSRYWIERSAASEKIMLQCYKVVLKHKDDPDIFDLKVAIEQFIQKIREDQKKERHIGK